MKQRLTCRSRAGAGLARGCPRWSFFLTKEEAALD